MKTKAPPKKRKRPGDRKTAGVARNVIRGGDPVPDRLAGLAAAVSAVAAGTRVSARTARLLSAGSAKMAQKVIEEAAEVGIEAVRGDVPALVLESADLLYNLVVLWTHLGVSPDQIWSEMDRREAQFGIAEKLPKPADG